MTHPDAIPEQGARRETQVKTIFSEIAPRYDLLNHVLSLNIDRAWRRRAVDALGSMRAPDGRYLDACSGTCDLALELANRDTFAGTIIASDFAQPMLVVGHAKLRGRPVAPVCGDTLELPFPDASFDGATVGFGVRNLADLDRGLREFRRVLRPGARLVVLEFTTPPNPVVKAGYHVYFNRILPVIGRLVSGHPWAYTYLPESVKRFPGPDALRDRLLEAGFRTADYQLLSFGIAAIHVAEV
ncbi:MAG: bifunctional demethylmenaquinone methyltransferase/2-methoxy-6-polyprenyl-1,4-benzoquinol methylase UbiE [Longimicrobiales bacterium]|nr:bifunctional demethylmenaquinone methyltransferase/2-methoxy-6-polyprenyl-1,4-benzoquinol methylase UbiE [Longimicrobiales bacterium]